MIPRGIEILVKKASVDAEFRGHLLTERSGAAGRIGLQLAPAEVAMLNAIPETQLLGIIGATEVPPRLKPVFMGYAAAAMLAIVGGLGCNGTGGESGRGETIKTEEPYDVLNDTPKKPEHSFSSSVTGIRPNDIGILTSSVGTNADISVRTVIRASGNKGTSYLSKEEIARRVRPYTEALLVDYYETLNKDRELKGGYINVKVTVSKTGKVTGIITGLNSTGNAELGNLVIANAENWRFPETELGTEFDCFLYFDTLYR